MQSDLFYLAGRNTENGSGGIYGVALENSDPVVRSFHELHGVSYMSYSCDRSVLYASCAVGKEGAVAAFKINPDKSLTLLNKLPSSGVSTCYVIAAPGGKYLYTASYFTSNISEFSLNGDGSLNALERVLTFTGRGVHPRQDKPHPHYVNFTPDKKKLLVVDLGLDEIKMFDFDPGKGLLDLDRPAIFKVEPAGSGPRHLVFNTGGDMAYLINELGNTVSVLSFDGSEFQTKQLVSTLPEDFRGESKTAAIRLSEDEKYLFASNRGYDSIAIYKVQENGLLELKEIVPSGGEGPRDIAFLPGYKYFAAANESSGNAAFFAYNEKTGALTRCSKEIVMPGALAIYW